MIRREIKKRKTETHASRKRGKGKRKFTSSNKLKKKLTVRWRRNRRVPVERFSRVGTRVMIVHREPSGTKRFPTVM